MFDTIGQRIKYLREKHHLNQVELAKIIDVSNRTISAWELDIKEPRMGAIEKLASYFGVRKTDLIDGSDYIFNPTHLILSEDEESIAIDYRNLNDENKKMLKEYILYLKFRQCNK